MAHFLELILAFKQLGTPHCLLYGSEYHFRLQFIKIKKKETRMIGSYKEQKQETLGNIPRRKRIKGNRTGNIKRLHLETGSVPHDKMHSVLLYWFQQMHPINTHSEGTTA
jgi:hypothetical protein